MSTDHPPRAAILRILAAFGVALAFALGVYLLLEATQPANGLVGFAFLLALPAAICAFVAYVADPWKTRSHHAYLMVPVWIILAVGALALAVLREGVICVLLLSPLWLISGMVGVEIAWRARRRTEATRVQASAVLLLPLVAMQVEPYVPLPVDTYTVARSIVVAASPERIWPLIEGIPDVRAGEGAWNISQDVIGIPRPIGARLVGRGVGADRYAVWGDGVRFRERVTEWAPGRRLGWRFLFDDVAGWAYTDRHLMPDSPYFTVTSGRYRIEPLAHGRTRLTLETDYRVTTPVNFYTRLWGELLLGDVERNLLALVRDRAEVGAPAPTR